MKPYVVCHMMMSLDGRIASSRWNLSPEGRAEYEATAATFQANAWMCGRITMAAFARGTVTMPASDAPHLDYTDYIAPHAQTSYAVAIDPGGKLWWESSDISGDHVVAVLTEKVSPHYLAHLQSRRVSYLFAGRDRIELPVVLDKLATSFQIRTLLLEGGGKINGTMLDAGLIDELSVLVAPVADGTTGAPALFDTFDSALSNTAGLRWRLRTMERRAGDIVWLRYSATDRGSIGKSGT
jgi:2,5-diamino-6-(ribosylamino)-4(3H)-pyrimidinone 5'-phosphate reductase